MPKKKGIDGKKIDSSEPLERRHFSLPSDAIEVVDRVSDEFGIPRSCVVSIALTKREKFDKLANAAGVETVKKLSQDRDQVQDQEPKGELSWLEEDIL